MRIEETCRKHLKRITELLPLLHEALEKGTAKDNTNVPPGIEQARAYRQERIERDQPRRNQYAYLPDSPVPVNLDVVMAINDMRVLLASAMHYAKELIGIPRNCTRCQHVIEDHNRTAGGACGKCRQCENFRMELAPANDKAWRNLIASDVRVAYAVEPTLAKVVDLMETALDLTLSGKLILVRCPWCKGISEAMPGGSLTLRVYVPGTAPETYVLCTNPDCDPPAEVCGNRFAGRPMWPFPELDWLAQKLDQEADKQLDEREERDLAAKAA